MKLGVEFWVGLATFDTYWIFRVPGGGCRRPALTIACLLTYFSVAADSLAFENVVTHTSDGEGALSRQPPRSRPMIVAGAQKGGAAAISSRHKLDAHP